MAGAGAFYAIIISQLSAPFSGANYIIMSSLDGSKFQSSVYSKPGTITSNTIISNQDTVLCSSNLPG